MSGASMKLSILTIDKPLFEGEAISVSLPGIYGRLQVLEHHIPLITALKKGTVRVETSEGMQEFFVESGTLEVRPEEVNVLVS